MLQSIPELYPILSSSQRCVINPWLAEIKITFLTFVLIWGGGLRSEVGVSLIYLKGRSPSRNKKIPSSVWISQGSEGDLFQGKRYVTLSPKKKTTTISHMVKAFSWKIKRGELEDIQELLYFKCGDGEEGSKWRGKWALFVFF